MTYFINFLFISFLTFAGMQISDPTPKARGLRIDPSYFYNLYPGLSASEIAQEVVSKARVSGINTLFIYAYNPVYGALYPTDYKYATVEGGFGQLNIFRELTAEAKKFGLKVIAGVPVNNFKDIWNKKPAWRAKNKTGGDYIPVENMYLLSAWHPEFRTWLTGFYRDLINRNPDIDGLEAVEPFIDYRWLQESDFNPVANTKFKSLYPSGKLGDQNWLNFRAQGLTDLISLMNSTANSLNKSSYLIFTWPVKEDGRLLSNALLKDNIGLNPDGILSLTGDKKLNCITVELIWQQWAAEYGVTLFPVSWTKRASLEFIKYVNSRAAVIIHVEVTPFIGSNGSVITPTLQEFSDTLLGIRDLSAGIDVYDYTQIEYLNAWRELLSWLNEFHFSSYTEI